MREAPTFLLQRSAIHTPIHPNEKEAFQGVSRGVLLVDTLTLPGRQVNIGDPSSRQAPVAYYTHPSWCLDTGLITQN